MHVSAPLLKRFSKSLLMEVEGIEYFNPKDFVNSHFTIVCAKRRGGKSTIIGDFINKQFQNGDIDIAILFTGTGADFPKIRKNF